MPSSEKIKLPHGILGYFFTGYPDWEVGSTRMYKKLLQLSRDESRVEPEPEKPGKSSKSKTRVILARTRVPELQVRVLVAGFSMDAAILFSH